MPDDIVHKFVSLRAPVATGETEALIEPGEHARPFEDAVGRMPAGRYRDRVIRAAIELRGTALYPLHVASGGISTNVAQAWLALYRSDLSKQILAQNFADAAAFQARVETTLNRFTLKSGDPKTRTSLWTGYLTSIFSPSNTRLETRFFHEWIHILDAMEKGKFRDLVPLTRLALPGALSTGLTEDEAPRGQFPNPNQGPGTGTARPSKAPEFTRLTNLSVELANIARTRRETMAAQTAARTGPLLPPQGTAPARGNTTISTRPRASGTTPNIPKVTVPANVRGLLDALPIKDLSADGQATMRDFRFDARRGIEQTRADVTAALASLYREEVGQTFLPKLGYSRGTLFRTRGFK